jgi:hypothetical protein
MGLQGNIQQGRHGGFAHRKPLQVFARKKSNKDGIGGLGVSHF